jgi:vitamin B12 transporter
MISPLLTPRASVAARSLLAVAASAALAVPAWSQVVLAPIVVTGSREPQPLDRVTADVVVIDADRIRSSTADSVEDLLRREAGVQLSRTGGPGQSANVFIRGAGAQNTLVLVDGVRIGSATLGQVAFESLGLSQIDRIEVLRGPGSSLYGADAVGGVVQIFTKRGEGEPRITARAAVGGYHSFDTQAGVSGAQGGFDYAASLGREGSRGVSSLKPGDQFGNYNPDDDGFQRNTAQARLGFTPAAGHRVGLSVVGSQLDARYDSSEFAPPTFTQDSTPDFHGKLATDVIALDYRGEITPAWTTTGLVSHGNDDLRSGADIVNRFRTLRDQLTWQNALKFGPDQQVMVALEYLNEKGQSDAFVEDVKRDNTAAVLGYTGSFGAHVIQADLRHDHNSVYGNNTTGRLGWSMEVARNLRVRALAGTTFRAPSFNDLYYPGYGVDQDIASRYGGQAVTAEKGRSVELGLNWREGDNDVSFTVYNNRVRDMIVYETDNTLCPVTPTADYAFGCARNVGRARLQGATLTGSTRFGAWRMAATADVLDAKDLDTGNRLTRRAAHQESLSADYEVGAWSAGAAVLSVGSRPDGGATLAAYQTLDLRAHWRWTKQWQLEAKLLNATNREIEPARDYQSPGRQAWIGVRYDGKGL